MTDLIAELHSLAQRMAEAGETDEPTTVALAAEEIERLRAEVERLRDALAYGKALGMEHDEEVIERACKAVMPGPCSPPDDPPFGFQEYCEGIAAVRNYANQLRQQTKKVQS